MRVISLKILRQFWDLHPDAEEPLRQWYNTAKAAEWANLTDARATYASADGVKTKNGEVLTIFNIGGNKYRLVTRIRYDFQLVNIRAVLTHADYDNDEWKG